MWLPVALWLVASASGFPSDVTEVTTETSTEINLEIQKDINLIAYIQNFKNVMAGYVSSQYNSLTVNEMDKVKSTLEEFLKCFANDLRDTIEGKNNEGLDETINDGIPNETFQDIKSKIVQEFPDVDENTADKIVKKLRRNLLITRHKLDVIINESKRAQIENS